eukprot:jgi/Psemu1/201000/e_gw1.269.3.1
MGTLVAIGLSAKAWPLLKSCTTSKKSNNIDETKPAKIVSLQRRFLPVFFLFRMSFWMSGPYFHQVYSTKTLSHIGGTTSPATKDFVTNISLVGYLSIALLGPPVGRLVDRHGRKAATVCTGLMYAIGSLSVLSNIPSVLYAGRALVSIASSRLTSTPEAWLIGDYISIQTKKTKGESQASPCWLSETFGLAYGGDALVAILAGQTATLAASYAGSPTGPFSVGPLFVAIALLLIIFLWAENNGGKNGVKVIFSDPKIVMVGLIQSLFEGSMYIFVLVWPPVFSKSIRKVFGQSAVTPFGTIFSCFMACCLLGSIIFGQLRKTSFDLASIMVGILFVSTSAFSWSVRAIQTENLGGIIVAFFAFEACVGMYFPSIGIIRSQVLPESHRSVITTLFAIPLNLLVVSVILSQSMLGDIGALTIASFAMGIATACMILLQWEFKKEKHRRKLTTRQNWLRVKAATKFAKLYFETNSSGSRELKQRVDSMKQFQRSDSCLLGIPGVH